MQKDETVIVLGEDVAGGTGAPGEQDAWGGSIGVTKGLLPMFGPERVIDTPIMADESVFNAREAFIGAKLRIADIFSLKIMKMY